MMRTEKFLLRIIGIIGLILFIVPIFYEFRNIGTVTGIVLSLLLILYSFYMEEWNQWFKNGREGKNILSLYIQFLMICILIMVIYISALIFKGGRPQTNDSRTVIVLGCEVNKDGTPSILLESRLITAKNYLVEHPSEVVVVSGSNMRDHESEAESSYHWLVANGIDASRIYKDTKATSTKENIENSYQIIQDNNLNPNVALSTNSFHMNRALKNANQLHINATALEAPTPWWLWPTYYLREIYAILYDAFFR